MAESFTTLSKIFATTEVILVGRLFSDLALFFFFNKGVKMLFSSLLALPWYRGETLNN